MSSLTTRSTSPQLVDPLGRVHTNLRISVTDRCNIRCFYCMPDENLQFKPRREILTFEEITRFVRIVTRMGISKLRLTGGEPLVRADLPRLVAMLVAWAALMIRGARDPLANRAIVDSGILANALHGLVMLVQAFVYPHEHQHLWADVPLLFVICAVLWRWIPAGWRGEPGRDGDRWQWHR